MSDSSKTKVTLGPSNIPFVGDQASGIGELLAVGTAVGTASTILKSPQAAKAVGLYALESTKRAALAAPRIGLQAIKAAPYRMIGGIGTSVMATAASGIMMESAASAAEDAGFNRMTGMTLSGLAQLGATMYTAPGTGGWTNAILSKVANPTTAKTVSNASKLGKLKYGVGALAAGTVAGNLVLTYGYPTDGPVGFGAFGATDEQIDKHVGDFTTIELFGTDVPNIDPVTSVFKTVGAFGDLSEANQERGNHGDSFGDAALFVSDQVSAEVEDMTGSKAVGFVAGGAAAGTILVAESIGAVADGVVGVVDTGASIVASGLGAVGELLTPW